MNTLTKTLAVAAATLAATAALATPAAADENIAQCTARQLMPIGQVNVPGFEQQCLGQCLPSGTTDYDRLLTCPPPPA